MASELTTLSLDRLAEVTGGIGCIRMAILAAGIAIPMVNGDPPAGQMFGTGAGHAPACATVAAGKG